LPTVTRFASKLPLPARSCRWDEDLFIRLEVVPVSWHECEIAAC
jgi:hypothetical protein